MFPAMKRISISVSRLQPRDSKCTRPDHILRWFYFYAHDRLDHWIIVTADFCKSIASVSCLITRNPLGFLSKRKGTLGYNYHLGW